MEVRKSELISRCIQAAMVIIMLNNPWILGGSPMSHVSSQMDGLGGSGHMVVQTQSVSIASSDGSVIHQTNTYESWVTVTGPQPMNLDLPCARQNIFGSIDMGAQPAITSRAPDTFLALPVPTDSLSTAAPALGMQSPFVAHNQVEPVMALPAQMAVGDSQLMASVPNPAETFIAVPVPQTCDQLVAVPTVQNLYNPLVGASEPSVPYSNIQTTPQATQTNSMPSWYLVVQDIPDIPPGGNCMNGSSSVVRTDDDMFLCMRCNSTFEKASCINWHLRECKGDAPKTSVAATNNVASSTPVEVKTVQCSLCTRLFTALISTTTPFVCSDCGTSTVPYTFSFGGHPLKQFKCTECDDCFQFESELEDHQNSHQCSVTICELPDNYVEENGNNEDEVSVIAEPMVEAPEDNDESGSLETDSSDDCEPDHNAEHCGECGDSFSQREPLEEHLKSHGDIRSYGCTKCGTICVGKYSLNRHVWAHSREAEEKENVTDSCFEEQEDNTKDGVITHPFGCTECGMQFSDSNDLKEHCVSHLRSKPFLCTQCGEKFETTSSLERHWVAHASFMK
ncbi:Zinc finger protein 408 [Frankliniella fusca]|uniref:Zinc finger protein 408 n=1 Tax=Frankliniella fusca TaxID=407009 RepID=A0AAE1H0B2_9NEOP|nr:Zinc finger protein 408 [Frankliniella fusca]